MMLATLSVQEERQAVLGNGHIRKEIALEHALDQMESQLSHVQFSTYASLLRECGKTKALAQGRRVHAHIEKFGHEQETFLGNLLVEMYGKCRGPKDARNVFDQIRQRNVFSWTIMIAAYAQNGHLQDARAVFDKMPERNVVSWNTMITTYAQNGHDKQALRLFCLMDLEGVRPSYVTFLMVLEACGNISALAAGKVIHENAATEGLSTNVAVGAALVTMYGNCRSAQDARLVFGNMPEKNVVAWTAMLTAYTQNGHSKEALRLFRGMLLEGVKPDVVAIISILDACATLTNLAEGESIHASIVESGFMMNLKVGNALVNMYGKCGSVHKAKLVFDGMPQRNVVSWTAMVAANAQNEQAKEALELFRIMDLSGVLPDDITFVSAIDACASMQALTEGKAIHDCIFSRSNVAIGTALMNMYGKCEDMKLARRVFEEMPQSNVASWNGIITGYAQNRQWKEAVQFFRVMDLEGIVPDRITLVTILDACANGAALAEGKAIHSSILSRELLSELRVGNVLVNMYGKCGSLDNARNVFENLQERDIVSWTAMIEAYAQNGLGKEAVDLFRLMELEGIKPNEITFTSIVSACTHAGLLNDGLLFFASQVGEHGLGATTDQYVGLVDLLGRAGHLAEAEDLINNMPYEPHAVTWTTLLSGCRLHGDFKRGARTASQALLLDPDNNAPYCLLSSMFAEVPQEKNVDGIIHWSLP